MKMSCSGVEWRPWAAILGGTIINLTLGTLYTVGNMSPYFTSYIRQYSEPSNLRYQHSSIIFALAMAGMGVFLTVGGFLGKKIGVRLMTLFGSWTMSIGVMTSCVTIQHSFTLFCLTYGGLVGIGTGLAYVSPLACAMRWMPKRKGLVSGLVIAGFGGGAFFFNQLQTALINPRNLVVNASLPNHQDEKYFDDESLLLRVPGSFLLFGGIYATLQLIGCLLISNPPEKQASDCGQMSLLSEDSNLSADGMTTGDCNIEDTAASQEDPMSSGLNLKPIDIIKTRAFWTLWTTFFINGQINMFVALLFKAYGQTFILDDEFLSVAGSFGAVFNAVGRLFWGYFADVYSYKVAMVTLCFCEASLLLSLIATPMGGKAMFFIWICALFFTVSGNYSLFPTVIARSFGSDNMGVNYGLVFTSQLVAGPVGAYLPVLKDIIGWFGLFVLNASFCIAGAILTLSYNMKTANGHSI